MPQPSAWALLVEKFPLKCDHDRLLNGKDKEIRVLLRIFSLQSAVGNALSLIHGAIQDGERETEGCPG